MRRVRSLRRSCPTNAFPARIRSMQVVHHELAVGHLCPGPPCAAKTGSLGGDCVGFAQRTGVWRPPASYPVPLEKVEDPPGTDPALCRGSPVLPEGLRGVSAAMRALTPSGRLSSVPWATLANDSAVDPLGRTLHRSRPQNRAYSPRALGRIERYRGPPLPAPSGVVGDGARASSRTSRPMPSVRPPFGDKDRRADLPCSSHKRRLPAWDSDLDEMEAIWKQIKRGWAARFRPCASDR